MNITTNKIGDLDCKIVRGQASPHPDVAVILCHGFGAPGDDLVPLASEMLQWKPEFSKVAFVFPAAPLVLDPGYDARAWWMIDVDRLQHLIAVGETRQMRTVDPPELPERRRQIEQIIQWVKKNWTLSPNKIVLGGFSQGSMLATDVALNSGDLLGGVIIWSGALICEDKWKVAAEKQKSLRVVQSHGQYDPILAFDGAVELKEMLSGAGHSVDFTAFPGPHTIPMEAFESAASMIQNAIQSS